MKKRERTLIPRGRSLSCLSRWSSMVSAIYARLTASLSGSFTASPRSR